MRPCPSSFGIVLLVACLGSTFACGGADDPEIVAITYLRAIHLGRPDEALQHIDMDRMVERVEDNIVLVDTPGDPRSFMRESIETVLWGLLQESAGGEYGYDAAPADVEGNRAVVVVRLTDVDGETTERTLHLRRTANGWKVSGETLDRLVIAVTQRLEERY